MADYNKPTVLSDYTDFPDETRDARNEASQMFELEIATPASTNIPDKAKGYDLSEGAFKTRNDGGGTWDNLIINKIVTDSSDIEIQGGNLGIGTASPVSQLHINESTSNASFAQFTNSDTGVTATDGLQIGVGADENSYIYNYENTHMIFATNNLERMRIENGGNIGINNNSPSYTLDVIGQINASLGMLSTTFLGVGTVSLPTFSFTGDTNTGMYNISSDKLGFATNGTFAMAIDSSQNIGFGSESPLQKIHSFGGNIAITNGSYNVEGSVDIYLAGGFQDNNSRSGIILRNTQFVGGSTEFEILEALKDPGGFGAYTDGSTRFKINNSGLVSIGTNQSGQNLLIHQDTSDQSYIQFTNTTTGIGPFSGALVGLDSGEDTILWTTEVGKSVKFGTSNVERVRIDSLGNVGIGGVSSNEKLEVFGNILATSTEPVFKLNETDGAVDEKNWRMWSTGSSYYVSLVNDAETIIRNAITIDRAGTNIDIISFGGDVEFGNKVNYKKGVDKVISAGVISISQAYHRVDTEAAAASDDLDTINGGSTGDILILQSLNDARDVTLTAAGNIKMSGGSFTLSTSNHTVQLLFDGTNWVEISTATAT